MSMTRIESTELVPAQAALLQLLEKIFALIPADKKKGISCGETLPNVKRRDFTYKNYQAVLQDSTNYASYAVCILYNAYALIKNEKLLEENTSATSYYKLLKYFRSLDEIFYDVSINDKNFEILKISDSTTFALSGLSEMKTTVEKGKINIEYTQPGIAKPASLSISPSRSWVPHVVCGTTANLAEIIINFSKQRLFINFNKKNKYYNGFMDQLLLSERVLTGRCHHYFSRIKNQELENEATQLHSTAQINRVIGKPDAPIAEVKTVDDVQNEKQSVVESSKSVGSVTLINVIEQHEITQTNQSICPQ